MVKKVPSFKYAPDKISVILNTLNEANRPLEDCLRSIKRNKPHQLIAADGGSSDNTLDICRRHCDIVLKTEKGILTQQGAALEHVTGEYLIVAESDMVYPDGLFISMYNQMIKSGEFAIQCKTEIYFERNFFEKALKIYYQLLQEKNGIVEVPTGPTIWKSNSFIEIYNWMKVYECAETYSTDTIRANIMRKKQLYVVRSPLVAYQFSSMNFSEFKNTFKNYGEGDFAYLKQYFSEWSILSIIKSLSYVLRKYGFFYPYKIIKSRKNLKTIPFFFLIVIYRYSGFLTKAFQHFFRKQDGN